MDQPTQDRLATVISRCHTLIVEGISQAIQTQFGIYADVADEVHVKDEALLVGLSEEDRVHRRRLLAHYKRFQGHDLRPKEALSELIREATFTHLNRLCAFKLMEVQGIHINERPFLEAVSQGLDSAGFRLYLDAHHEDWHRYRGGEHNLPYRHFLEWLSGQFQHDMAALFSPHNPASSVFPPHDIFAEVFRLLSNGGLVPSTAEWQQWNRIWQDDEIIGWICQFSTPAESQNGHCRGTAVSRGPFESVFHKACHTPHQIVEFLVDNTLGRLWYEMRKADTRLKDQCRYMWCGTTEVLLREGGTLSQQIEHVSSGNPEESTLEEPAYIPHRPKKDPRELKIRPCVRQCQIPCLLFWRTTDNLRGSLFRPGPRSCIE